MNCSGKRDATEKVQKKNMGDRMLLSGEIFFYEKRDDPSWEEKVISSNDQSKIRTDKETNFVASSDSRFFISREPELFLQNRIPTVKLKIPGKSIFEIRNQNFCYIQVIVFDLSYLPVAAVGT